MANNKSSSPDEILDRPPIANEEMERYLLGACLANTAHADEVVDSMGAHEFTIDRHRLIFERIKDLRSMRLSPDRLMLVESLLSRGQLEIVGLSYLAELDSNAPSLASVTQYIRIVKDKADLRRIVDVANGVIQDAYSGSSAKEVVRTLESRIYKVSPSSSEGRVTRLGDEIDSHYIEWIDPRGHQSGAPLTTGYQKLDDLTGGVFPEEIWMWGASTGVGKTSILLQMAMHSLDRQEPMPVLLFSIEMSKQSLYRRLVCQRAMVSVKRFRTGELSPNERNKIVDATQFVSRLPLYIDATPHLTVADIRMRTQRAMEEHGIRWAGIDFIQKVRSTRPRNTTREVLNEVGEEMIEIAKETVPFHVLSQLNNDHRKTRARPTLGSLKESSNLAEIAHVTIAPFREAMEPGKASQNPGDAYFLMLKNREGELGEIKMRYIGWRMMWEDREYDPLADNAQQESNEEH